jgi:hypothetical protein
MQNLRLDQVTQELPQLVESKPDSIKTSYAFNYNMLLMSSVFFIGMAAGNIYHPYEGMLAIMVGTCGIFAYCWYTLNKVVMHRQQLLLKEEQLSASLNKRLQKHVAHSFKPHARKRQGTLIADRYRKLGYVPIANVDEI